jgi:hypothetical protein
MSTFTLPQQMTRTASLFQAIIALPAVFLIGTISFSTLFSTNLPIYDFMY